MDTPTQVVQHFVDILNEALVLDYHSVSWLMDSSTPANDRLVNHPTIVVNELSYLKFIGLFNGFTAKYNMNIVCIRSEGKIICFKPMSHDEFVALATSTPTTGGKQ